MTEPETDERQPADWLTAAREAMQQQRADLLDKLTGRTPEPEERTGA